MALVQIQGWKYTDEGDAQAKVALINSTYDYPKPGSEETKDYASYSDHYDENGEVTFWYFEYHPDIEAVLGAPQNFDVYTD